jgi:hypothetical protein|tara:strand:- start:131 stop:340 length:210 start_codon:yes stop_codon:yes gene_type:complete
MQKLMCTHESALEYLDMTEELFDQFIAPLVTTLKFEDGRYYLVDQLDEAIFDLISESPVAKGFKLHLVD